jgi:hypothetical protein
MIAHLVRSRLVVFALIGAAGCAWAAQAADAPAVVTVHPDRPGPTIPPNFLGLSCEKKILSRKCFVPENAVLLALLRNLGGGVLRVGANEVDSTFWSRSEAAPLASMDENKYSEKPSTIGPESLDKLYAFAKPSGWRVIHGVNLGANDPAMAADEAAYALEVGGPTVLAIEIGNEPNLYPKNAKRPGIRPANYGYPEYRQEFAGYVDAIRKRSPSAPLTGPATTRICKWFPDFVADFKPQMALITSHLYLLSAKEADPQSPRFASVENLLTRTVEPEWLPQLEASKAAGIPFRLGECNTASGGGSRGVSDAFASALWGVDFLFEVAERGGAGVNLHGGFTPGNYSPIYYLKKEARYEPSPLYYGMLLFHEAARGRLVQAECRSEANVKAHAVMDDDGVVRLVLLNKDLTRPVVAKVAGVAKATRAEVVRLAAPSVSATEGVTLGGRAVARDGTWSPQPGEAVPCADGQCEVSLPAASAAMLTIR